MFPGFFSDGVDSPVYHHAPGVLFIAGELILSVSALGFIYIVCLFFYNIFLHPLRHFPGPKLWAMTRLPFTRNELSGQSHKGILQLHKAYGPFVRIAPEIISISHPAAPTDLKGHRKAGQEEHSKDPHNQTFNEHNIIGANREDHMRFRQVMSRGFSAQTMSEQQPTIKGYVDILFKRLHEISTGGTRPVDMVAWYNYTTFDIIGDLAFGEPFGCLEGSTYHPWVAAVFLRIKYIAISRSLGRYPFGRILNKLANLSGLAGKKQQHDELSKIKLQKRLAAKTDRPDFVGKMLKGRGGQGTNMTFDELVSNASVLITAGSETTATLLSAATFFLCQSPYALAKLTEEVRSTFSSDDQIDLVTTQNMSYLQAVLDETLRMYPPVSGGTPRKIARGGGYIAGRFIPENTVVETPQWATYHNPAYFSQPDEFIPERWLGDERFKNDTREVMQPFSVGPRNCIGRNLAYAEMRLILARMIWNFDMHLAEDSYDWVDKTELYLLLDKAPLNVYLAPREKAASLS
ncbi:putative Cytochrome P450 [Seiridium cardinale]